ncbi:hypothetical protein C900_00089 [Fulvivirga imtechensis AK7]|uniref:Putative auto-transporter adhesin head GIN domain-containing protein n=1 Tax=Fulvivirga imtechensis AK7 TaxID=1237149 RepID=L8JYR7_9BACT|nr:DUF2807 domain-containing protein [Fulvivirga imtechensis]ELR73925.1 hypothetical protein C900_00089 [Fulvivirga imtechensis AK7]
MKSFILTTLVLISFLLVRPGLRAQERQLPEFDKIVISPLIELVLIKGNSESIKLETSNMDTEKVNIEIKNKTLRIYLDKAKMKVKYRKRDENGVRHWTNKSMYPGVKVKAYVTFRELKKLQVRGEEAVTCNDIIDVDIFKLKVFGKSEVRLAAVQADVIKVSLYGENDLYIDSGRAAKQVYKGFGENKVVASKVLGRLVRTKNYGEGNFYVNASQKLNIASFGDFRVTYEGHPRVRKGLSLGYADIERQDDE